MITIENNELIVEGNRFVCHNNTNLDGIYPLDRCDSKVIKDTTEYDEGWFAENYPILPRNKQGVLYVPRPDFEQLMEVLETREFWEVYVT